MTFHQPSSSQLISESCARANNILPLYIEDGKLVFATSEPLNFTVFEEIAMISGLEAKPFVSEASIIESAIENAYSFGQGPDDILEAMVTLIKIISGMNIAEKRISQDGAFTMNEDGISVDIQVTSIPTKNGEKLVLRLLGSEKSID